MNCVCQVDIQGKQGGKWACVCLAAEHTHPQRLYLRSLRVSNNDNNCSKLQSRSSRCVQKLQFLPPKKHFLFGADTGVLYFHLSTQELPFILGSLGIKSMTPGNGLCSGFRHTTPAHVVVTALESCVW